MTDPVDKRKTEIVKLAMGRFAIPPRISNIFLCIKKYFVLKRKETLENNLRKNPVRICLAVFHFT